METVDVLMKMPKIDGYEYTGEYRKVKVAEFYYSPIDWQVQIAEIDGIIERPILRKTEVWKPLTLEKALEMGKSRKHYTFRHNLVDAPGPGRPWPATVETIDLNPATPSNVRLSYYGWASNLDIEYLET